MDAFILGIAIIFAAAIIGMALDRLTARLGNVQVNYSNPLNVRFKVEDEPPVRATFGQWSPEGTSGGGRGGQ